MSPQVTASLGDLVAYAPKHFGRDPVDVYHTHRCNSYVRTFPHDLGAIWATEEQAQTRGYRLCRKCEGVRERGSQDCGPDTGHAIS